jgi:hypothetical protein
MTQSIDTVEARLEQALETVETTESELVGGVQAIVPDEETGSLFGLLRREFDSDEWEASRDPSGENMVVNIEAKRPEDTTLADLFK